MEVCQLNGANEDLTCGVSDGGKLGQMAEEYTDASFSEVQKTLKALPQPARWSSDSDTKST